MKNIDLVYLWLDPNDKNWQAGKNKWLEKLGFEPGQVCENTTWIQNDELKYSLRSVDKFAPWVNHIYIITSFGQVPDWLDTSNPKITIINDADIMPADAIPTFNSNAIESCMANIPGLSEYFLLANDDMFFGQPIGPDYFFDDTGRPIVWYARNWYFGGNYKREISRVGLWQQHHVSLFQLMERAFGKKYHRMMPAHNIDPYRKSHILAAQRDPRLSDAIFATIHNRFRRPTDIPRFVYSIYDYIHGKCVMRHRRVPKHKKHIFYNTWHGLCGNFKNSPQYHQTVNTVPGKLPVLFCVNKAYSDEFAKLFPEKSRFER